MSVIFPDKYIILITDLSILASLVSCGISIWLIVETKNIKKSFQMQARMPSITNELDKHYKHCQELLVDFENNQQEIKKLLFDTKVIVENAKNKLPNGSEKENCKNFINSFKSRKYFILKVDVPNFSEEYSRDLLVKLSMLITSLNQYQKDLKWR